ncbi:MAG: fatty acid oxidation complex subunit alpha FadJ [Desulfuromonas sp.]|nr:MAG: fatty acid oxidation complex subunit alpha FadJ [Desulfuromonas sp.]
MGANIQIAISDGIASVTLAAAEAKVNILNAGFLNELEQAAITLAANDSLKGVIVTSDQPGGFIAGADISEIESVSDAEKGAGLAAVGQRIFTRWENLPFPVVAAIHGHCMGGGTEFALACHFRIAAEDTTLALPEIKLGILPGFGGTQRLPRLISLEKALDIILSGRTVRAKEALSSGLVDRIANNHDLKHSASDFLAEIINNRDRVESARMKKQGGWRRLLLEKNPIGRTILFKQARKQLGKKTGGHYPAPLKALDVIETTYGTPLDTGLKLEAAALGELIITPESKNLVHLYHLSQRPKKIGERFDQTIEIKKAAVLGAGVMGGGIAHLLASRGIPTLIKDINQQALDAGIEHARTLFRKEIEKKNGASSTLDEKMSLLTPTLDYTQFADVDLVIEAVVEKIAIKQAVLKEAEPHLPSHAIFATNTSALSVSDLQTNAMRPGRVGGLHFFNPVDRMPLIEVVRGKQSSDETTGSLFKLAGRIGKTPIITGDRTGFLVNRLLVTYLLEAALAATEGVNWMSLDKLITRFGYPMGPFRLVDEVGIDIAVEVGDTLCQSFGYLQPTDLLQKILDLGLLGKKGEKGFYSYANGRCQGANHEIEQVLPATGRDAGHNELKRLLYLMVNEAGRCLDEGIIASPEDIDTGMVFGTGFPPFHGGLCRWADAEGLPDIVKTLKDFAGLHGERFAPCAYLQSKKRFYEKKP